MIFHISFKRNNTIQCEGVNIEAKSMISAIKQQQIDFKESEPVCCILSDGIYNKDIYSKQVERWNAQVDIDSLIIEN